MSNNSNSTECYAQEQWNQLQSFDCDDGEFNYPGWRYDYNDAIDAYKNGDIDKTDRYILKLYKKQCIHIGDRSHPKLCQLDAIVATLNYDGYEIDVYDAERIFAEYDSGSTNKTSSPSWYYYEEKLLSLQHKQSIFDNDRSHPNLVKLDTLVSTKLSYNNVQNDIQECEDAHANGDQYKFDRMIAKLIKCQRVYDGDRSHIELQILDKLKATLSYPGYQQDIYNAERYHYEFDNNNTTTLYIDSDDDDDSDDSDNDNNDNIDINNAKCLNNNSLFAYKIDYIKNKQYHYNVQMKQAQQQQKQQQEQQQQQIENKCKKNKKNNKKNKSSSSSKQQQQHSRRHRRHQEKERNDRKSSSSSSERRHHHRKSHNSRISTSRRKDKKGRSKRRSHRRRDYDHEERDYDNNNYSEEESDSTYYSDEGTTTASSSFYSSSSNNNNSNTDFDDDHENNSTSGDRDVNRLGIRHHNGEQQEQQQQEVLVDVDLDAVAKDPNIIKLEQLRYSLSYDGWEHDYKQCYDAHYDGHYYLFQRYYDKCNRKQDILGHNNSNNTTENRRNKHKYLKQLDLCINNYITIHKVSMYNGYEQDVIDAECIYYEYGNNHSYGQFAFQQKIQSIQNKQRIYMMENNIQINTTTNNTTTTTNNNTGSSSSSVNARNSLVQESNVAVNNNGSSSSQRRRRNNNNNNHNNTTTNATTAAATATNSRSNNKKNKKQFWKRLRKMRIIYNNNNNNNNNTHQHNNTTTTTTTTTNTTTTSESQYHQNNQQQSINHHNNETQQQQQQQQRRRRQPLSNINNHDNNENNNKQNTTMTNNDVKEEKNNKNNKSKSSSSSSSRNNNNKSTTKKKTKTPPSSSSSLIHGNCVVCKVNTKANIFVPCGHICACSSCAIQLVNRNIACPICHKYTHSSYKVFTV